VRQGGFRRRTGSGVSAAALSAGRATRPARLGHGIRAAGWQSRNPACQGQVVNAARSSRRKPIRSGVRSAKIPHGLGVRQGGFRRRTGSGVSAAALSAGRATSKAAKCEPAPVCNPTVRKPAGWRKPGSSCSPSDPARPRGAPRRFSASDWIRRLGGRPIGRARDPSSSLSGTGRERSPIVTAKADPVGRSMTAMVTNGTPFAVTIGLRSRPVPDKRGCEIATPRLVACKTEAGAGAGSTGGGRRGSFPTSRHRRSEGTDRFRVGARTSPSSNARPDRLSP
jgi:hypothetical protein